MTCPSITELCASDASSAFRDHLADCARCRALLARIETSEPELGNSAVPAGGAGATPEAGAVWTVWAPHADSYLVAAILEAGEEELLVLPLMPDVRWASEADIELDMEVLGYPAVAPIWASDRILTEQAVEAVDVLSESWLLTLRTAFDAFMAGEAVEAPTGPRIIGDEDPRLLEQGAIAEELRLWYLPWAMLQGAEELGPVIAERREALKIEAESFCEELGVELRSWTSFEEAKADPYTTVPASSMARAVKELGFLASRRVVSLAEASVRAHNEGQDPKRPAAKARRMRGTTQRGGRDQNVVETAAKSYGESLARELGL